MKKYLFTAVLLIMFSKPVYAQIKPDTSFYIKNSKSIYGLVIAKNSKIIYQQFFNGKTDRSLLNDQSLTKGVISLLIGIAIDKGYISSVDEKISKYFPQLATDKDLRKQNITIRELMNQSSGLYHEDINDLKSYLKQKDPSGLVLKQPLLADPGTAFYYNNAASHLLSVILTKATNMPTFDFAKKFLFTPMDITEIDWAKMKDGFYDGGGLLSIRMHTQDLVKIGGLLLNNGFYGNKRLISSKWIKELNHPASTFSTEWGFKDSNYALGWYHFIYQGASITYALGWGGQYLMIIPKYKTIIAVNQRIEDEDAIMQSTRFVEKIFPVLYDEISKAK